MNKDDIVKIGKQAQQVGVEKYLINQIGANTSADAIKLMNLVKNNDASGLEQMAREVCKNAGLDPMAMYNTLKTSMFR